jgi:hypothetical protein
MVLKAIDELSGAHKQQHFDIERRTIKSHCDTVNAIVNRRGELVGGSTIPGIPQSHIRGSIIVFSPQLSMNDGLAAFHTQGYFDEENSPPWDYWIALLLQPKNYQTSAANEPRDLPDEFLISWVPPELQSTAENGIHANAEGCLYWARDSENPSIRHMAQMCCAL